MRCRKNLYKLPEIHLRMSPLNLWDTFKYLVYMCPFNAAICNLAKVYVRV